MQGTRLQLQRLNSFPATGVFKSNKKLTYLKKTRRNEKSDFHGLIPLVSH